MAQGHSKSTELRDGVIMKFILEVWCGLFLLFGVGVVAERGLCDWRSSARSRDERSGNRNIGNFFALLVGQLSNSLAGSGGEHSKVLHCQLSITLLSSRPSVRTDRCARPSFPEFFASLALHQNSEDP